MATVKEIYDVLDKMAPFRLQMDFDNAGFLVGRGEQEVAGVLVALDITEDVIDEASKLGAQLIVAHHPVIFHPLRSVTDADVTGRKLLAMIEHGISAICAHTNLDAAQDGVNDQLARTIGLKEIGQLHQDGVDEAGNPYGIGRVGKLACSATVETFAVQVKERLQASCVRFVDTGKPVHRVAVGGGSCGSMLADVLAAGCDTFLTADVKHDVFLDAKALGVNLLDAGHFATEDVVCQPLVQRLREHFPDLAIVKSTRQREVFCAV